MKLASLFLFCVCLFPLRATELALITDHINGSNPDEYAQHITEILKSKHPGFNPEAPLEKSYIWFLSHWTRPDTKKDPSGNPIVSEKYGTFALENWAKCQQIASALQKTGHPQPYIDSWLRYYGFRIIQIRMPIDAGSVAERLAKLPKGEILSPKNHTDLEAALAQKLSSWSGMSPTERKRIYDVLDDINADLNHRRYYRTSSTPTEDRPHVVLDLKDGRKHVAVYRLEPNAQILLPDAGWLKNAAEKKEAFSGAEPPLAKPSFEEKSFELKSEQATYTLHVRLLNGAVHNAHLTNGTNNLFRSVIPLEAPIEGDDTWIRMEGGKPVGAARIIFRLGKTKYWEPVILTGDSFSLYRPKRKKGVQIAEQGSIQPASASSPTEVTASSRWTHSFGTTGTGVSPDARGEWVSDLRLSKLAWVSDKNIPDGRGANTRGKAQRILPGFPIMGGWASPIVANGKVFLHYYEPSGEAYAYGAKGKIGSDDPSMWKINLVEADDVVHCFDANTGKTLWKRVYPLKGVNWSAFNKGGPMNSPAISGDRLVVMGSAGKVYCLDIKTGQTIWETDNGARHELITHEIPVLKAEGQLFGSRNDFEANITIADGVAIVSDQRRTKRDYRYELGTGVMGFDLATGEKLWELPEVAGHNRFQQGAQLFVHEGKEYAIAADKTTVRVIEPKTGKILASLDGFTLRHTALGSGEGFIICDIAEPNPLPKGEKYRIAGLRFTGTTLEKAWEQADHKGLVGGALHMNGKAYIQVQTPENGVACVDLKTGQTLAFVAADIARGEHCPFIIGGNGRVIVCKDRTAGYIIFDADPAKFAASKREFRPRLATGYCGSLIPAIAGDHIFIRSPDRLFAHDLRQSSAMAYELPDPATAEKKK